MAIYGSPVRGTIYSKDPGGDKYWLSQPYGCTGYPKEPRLGDCAHFHRGLDILNGQYGGDVLAIASGTVKVSLRESNGENIIAIHHGDGVVSYYGHLERRLAAAGEHVALGEHIGDIGSTGNSSGPHIHVAAKTGVDLSQNLYPDSNGHWFNLWPRLAQNVRVKPKNSDGIRIRSSLSLSDSAIFAEVDAAGHIVSNGGVILGVVGAWRKWYAIRTGPTYTVGGVKSNRWEEFSLAGQHVYVASLLAIRSVS